jgi:hypothetical protein
VVVGQQIYLTITLSDGSDPSAIATSIDWGVPGAAIAGYTPITNTPTNINTAQIDPLVQTEQSTILFYWVFSGTTPTQSFPVSFTYCVDVEMQSCVTATATFNVIGPTGVNMTATPGPVKPFLNALWNNAPDMGFGNADSTPGMTFISTMAAPGGQNVAFFVQLINYDNEQDRLLSSQTTTCNLPADPPALDGEFPFPTNPTHQAGVDPNLATADSPGMALALPSEEPGKAAIPVLVEAQRLFSATMYLMWYPLSPVIPNCSGPGECSIPVPLGSITWTFAGDAIDTLQIQADNATTFVLNTCSKCTSPSMQFVPASIGQANYGYPTWSNLSMSTKCGGAGSTE